MSQVLQVIFVDVSTAKEESSLGWQELTGTTGLVYNLLTDVTKPFQMLTTDPGLLALVYTLLAVLHEPLMDGVGLAPISRLNNLSWHGPWP